jgi:hypothetical protein
MRTIATLLLTLTDVRAARPRQSSMSRYRRPRTPAASGPVAASRPADAPMAKVPYPEWATLAAVPFDDTTAFAEQCDANRAEVISWRAQREGTK